MPGPNGQKCGKCYWGECGAREEAGDDVRCYHTSALKNREWRTIEDIVERQPCWYCENFLNREMEKERQELIAEHNKMAMERMREDLKTLKALIKNGSN